MAGIFVNYRGRDSAWAVLLDRELTERFGPGKVFRASRSIRAGDDFVSRILDAVRSSSVLLAVIGPDWATSAGRTGRCRLHEPDDWVRREIAEAFVAGLAVVPILAGDAPPPGAAELPGDIARLARCQYLRLHHRSVTEDVDRIARELSDLDPSLGGRRAPAAGRPAGQVRRRRPVRCPRLVLTTVAAAVAAVAAAAALVAGPVHRAGDGGAAALRATVEVPAEAEAVVGNAIRIAGVLSGPMPPGRRLLGIVHDGRDQYYPALAQLSAGGRWWADLAIGPAAMLSRTHAFELIVATGDERAMAAIAEWHHTKAVDGMSRLPDGTARLASRNVRRLR